MCQRTVVHQPARQGDSILRAARTGCAGRDDSRSARFPQGFRPCRRRTPGLHLISIDRPGFGGEGRVAALSGADRRCPRVTDCAQARSGGSRRARVRRHARPRCSRRYPQDVASLILVAPGAGGLRSKTMDVLQARFIRFSQWPVIRTIVDATVGDVIKRISATSGAENAFGRSRSIPLLSSGCCRWP